VKSSGYDGYQFHDPAFAVLDTIPAVTDRHVAIAKTALCIASCG